MSQTNIPYHLGSPGPSVAAEGLLFYFSLAGEIHNTRECPKKNIYLDLIGFMFSVVLITLSYVSAPLIYYVAFCCQHFSRVSLLFKFTYESQDGCHAA